MSNEIATKGSYLTTEDYFAAVAGEAKGLKGGGDGKAFMKFSGNDGNYSYGADDTELPLGSQLVMDPRSYKRGWVIWVGGNVVYEDMRSLNDGAMVTAGQLPNHGPYGEEDGPSEQYTVDFSTTEAPFVGMVFQANNTSKRRAMAALLKDFGASYKMHPGKFPVVEIDAKEFDGKTKGGRVVKKHAPSFKIVAWVSEAEMEAMKEGAPEDYAIADQSGDAPAENTTIAAAKPAATKTAPAAAPAKPAPARARGRF